MGHRRFFEETDKRALQLGTKFDDLIRQAERRFAATAVRVDTMGRGNIQVEDEALLVEEMRTKLVGMGPLFHTLSLEDITKTTEDMDTLAAQVDQSLDKKVKILRLQRWALIPMWGFAIVFTAVLWVKYKRLKKAMVVPLTQ